MIVDFLDKIRNGQLRVIDPSILDRKCNPPSAMLPMCVDEMKQSVLNEANLKPIEGSYMVDNGLRLSRYLDSSVCYRPYRIDKDGDYIVVADHDKHSIFYFEKNFNLKKKYYLGAVSENRYPRCVCPTEDKIFVGTDYNRVICLDKDTEDVLWDFGVYNSRGKCSDDKIGEVMQIQEMPNGNIAIATYDGAGDANKWYGTVELFDTDGNWIKTLLSFDIDGEGTHLETYNPTSLRIYGDKMYVGKRNEIDIFYINDNDISFISTIRKPPSSGIEDLDLRDFVIDNGILYITSPKMKKVIGFNILTQKLEFSAGVFSYENSSSTPHKGNGLNYPDGIVLIDDHIYVCDSSNYNVTEVFRDDFMHPQYNIPQDVDIVYSSLPIDDDVVKTPVGEEPPELYVTYREK